MKQLSKLFSFSLPKSLRTRLEKFRDEKLSIPLATIIKQAIDEYLESRGY